MMYRDMQIGTSCLFVAVGQHKGSPRSSASVGVEPQCCGEQASTCLCLNRYAKLGAVLHGAGEKGSECPGHSTLPTLH